MPRSSKEQVDITALLQGILNGYPGNTAIFREYLQNSDDAKATKQIFILDERQHPSEVLCDPSLRDAQGPAIVAFNDGVLSDSDWEALRKIHSSSKKMDETQTGKNGLGFRASYHLTENPHVLSGPTLMILDPHHRFDEHPGGLSIDIVTEGAAYRDQLKPFMDFMSDVFSPVSGTIFRLPLRTEMQAKKSKIKNTPTPVGQIRTLLEDFCKNELEQVILFLKHITSIEIRHIDPDGHSRIMGTVSIKDIFPAPLSQKEVKFREISLRQDDGSITESRWCFRTVVIDKGDAAKVLSERLGYDVGDSLVADKLFSSVELATQVNGEAITGCLFTLLPLPIKTYFPLHLNAVFALTPDRQNLKNMEEVGTIQSRERRLVEWNKVIFEVWSPRAWADLLEELSASNAPWSMWPPAETNGYWENLTVNLVKEVLDRKSSIFPIVCDKPTFLPLDSRVLISPPSFPLSLIRLLAKLGVKIVQPPAHIFAILASNNVSISAPILSPETLHNVLAAGYEHDQWRPYDPIDIGEIIEYLVFSPSPPSLGNLIGLPWFFTANGSPFAFQGVGVGQTCIIPSEEEEVHLFGPYLQMLALSCSSDKLLSALRVSGSGMILNIASLQPSHVMTILSNRFALECEASSSDLPWVLAFWTWLEGWDISRRTCVVKWERLSDLYLLPTTSRHLRRTSDKVVHFNAADTSAATAWEKLGVPLLHSDVCTRAVIMFSNEGFIHGPEKLGFIPFLLDNSDTLLQHTLLPDDFEAIRQSLYSATIRPHFSFLHAMDFQQKKILEQLLIFSVRNPNGGRPTLTFISGRRLYVLVSDDFPLPFQSPPVTYVDIGDPTTKALVQVLGPFRPTDMLDLLCIAVDHWNLQPLDLQDRLIDLIFDNWRKLPKPTQRKLVDLPFVMVNGTPARAPPKNLIHPNAPITSLFEDEVGRIPIGRFAAYPTVDIMHSLGFLPTSLDRTIIQERLRYLCQNSSHDQKLFDKAKMLVQLMDQHWEGSFDGPIRSHRDLPWMPQEAPSILCSPDRSRDHYRGSTHSYSDFYDLVLTVLSRDAVYISNRNFRSALGWSDRVSTGILVDQLSKTILLPESEERYRRLNKIITYMSRLHENDSFLSEDVLSIRSKLTSRSWIPISASTVQTVKTEYALLSGEYLKPPFRQIGLVGCGAFLLAMGCTKRPTSEVLISELQKYNTVTVPDSDIPAVIALLQEIATYHPGFDSATVLVPDQSGCTHPISDIYYPDTDTLLPRTLEAKYPIHDSVSRTLSYQLGIRPLSSLILELGEDAFDDDEQMGEDLIDRIQGFLREYDISYAFNEFLANADDARAQEFSILLDHSCPSQGVNGLISPAFYELQNCDSIILFNDGIFSDEDFKGLRKVGRGGKAGQVDTHGRHGLGALSLYYFTDVVTVISGEYVMILDPSGRYLPPNRGQKRTSLIRKISEVVRQYPNHLRQYESYFKFSKDTTFYRGTLFCLPLTRDSSISVKHCNRDMANKHLESSYRELAQHAFFFTRLEKITARARSDQDEERILWSFEGHRQDSQVMGGGLSYRLLSISSGRGRLKETWMVSTSEGTQIPENHKATALGLKLKDMILDVQLAIRLKPDLNDTKNLNSWLFSNLRLPRTTSFPFHLSARFAISSNRQGIVFDSPDSRKERDPKSEFNAWILADVVPPLYLASLAFIVKHEAEHHILSDKRWWLQKPSDDISKHVSQAFLTLLAKSERELFKTTDGTLLSFSNSIFAMFTAKHDAIIRALCSLKAPQLVTDYVPTGLAKLEAAKTVNETYVRSVLGNTSLDSIKRLYVDGIIKLDQLLALLRYIRKETKLAGLPLLILSTNIPVHIPGTSGRRIYLSEIPEHASLFKSAWFLHYKYSEDQILDEIWSSPSINVGRLTKPEMLQLIRDELNRPSGAGQEEWLKNFWACYDNLPQPPSFTSLGQANIKLVQGSLRCYSLNECEPTRVIFAHNVIKDLLLPLRHLGIDVLELTGSRTLNTFLLERFPQADAGLNILKCLAGKNITRFGTIPPEEAKSLRSWLVAYIGSNVSSWRQNDKGIDRSHLLGLEIWAAQTREGERFSSASGLSMLPPHFSKEALSPYLRPGCAITPFSNKIAAVLTYHLKRKKSTIVTMNPVQILDAMEIPAFIGDDQMDKFANFLHNLFSFSSSALDPVASSLRVFDVDGRARLVHALYDHSVPLFSKVLNPSSFLHPQLRDVSIVALRALGLKYEISITTFRACVEAVQAAHRRHIQEGKPTRAELFEMAGLAFRSYKSRLPREIMRNSSHWSKLDCIEFVRAKDIRRQGASYPAEDYCDQLPDLLPPSRFILPSLEPIAWTQRALFFDDPSEDVIAVNKALGIPGVGEVVAHLKILTTKIAISHPGNPTLLSDIKATYRWLNDHAEDAREHLLCLEGEQLFLNVDDPSEDWWVGQWVTAGELILDIPYDIGNMRHVKKFLQGYADLLRAANCSTMSRLPRKRKEQPTDKSNSRKPDLMETLNEMRKSGNFADVVLVPTAQTPEEMLDLEIEAGQGDNTEVSEAPELLESVEEHDGATGKASSEIADVFADLRAHRIILAASIPYVRTWAEWNHGTSRGIDLLHFDGTHFGAKAVLDFAYTGDFKYTLPEMDDIDGLQNLLYELLALLSVADLWDMPELKAKVESEIGEHDLVRRLVPLYRIMLNAAKRYNANDLKDALSEMARDNDELLRKLGLII